MLEEIVEYQKNLPIKIDLANLEKYPMHWHNALEIICVLEGSLKVRESYQEYLLTEGDMMIINTQDLHSISQTEESNLILMMQIDINKYKKKYPDIDKMIFVCDSYLKKEKKSLELKRIMASVVQIYKKGKIDKSSEFNELISELLSYLINDYKYFYIDEKKFKNNNKFKDEALQLERIYRITDYMYKNYMNKITLDEIGERENISAYYVSHIVKYANGLGFQDFLNFIRAEQSERMLLESNKSIEEIAFDVGFSAKRYYDSHFEKWFQMKPYAYRKKYKRKNKFSKDGIKYNVFNMDQAQKKLDFHSCNKSEAYFETNEKEMIRVDLNNQGEAYESGFNKMVWINDFREIFDVRIQHYIEEISAEIGLEYLGVGNIFELKEQGLKINYLWFKKAIDEILSLNLKPAMIFENRQNDFNIELFEVFIKKIAEVYGSNNIAEWKYIFADCKGGSFEALNDQIEAIIKSVSYNMEIEQCVGSNGCHVLNDRFCLAPYLFSKEMDRSNLICYQRIMDLESDFLGKGSFFNGGCGMYTVNGYKKPNFIYFSMISKLGERLIEKKENCLIMRQGENIQIIFANYKKECNIHFENILEKNEDVKKILSGTLNYKKEFVFKLENIKGCYKVKKFTFGEKKGSAYEQWQNLGGIRMLKAEDEKLIKKASIPQMMFSYIKDVDHYDIKTTLEPFEIQLILIEKDESA